jgi:hypothetical protein
MMLLLRLLLLTALACGSADAQMMQSIVNSKSTPASTYVGPGDVVSSATAWYGLRAYNNAYAAATSKAIKLRRQSDNFAQDVLVTTTGDLDVAAAYTLAGTDGTATCSTSGSSTTLTCTGATGTPVQFDSITGSGITQPAFIYGSGGCGSVVAGAVTCNMYKAQSISSTTVTFHIGLWVKTMYDQSGSSACSGPCDMAQQGGDGVTQPLFLPVCIGGKPCFWTIPVNSVNQVTTAGLSSALASQPISLSYVGERTGNTSSFNLVLSCAASDGTSINVNLNFSNTGNTAGASAGSNLTGTASDNAAHAFQALFNGGSSALNIDGTDTTGSAGSGTCASTSNFISMPINNNALGFEGYTAEGGLWPIGLTLTQRGNLHSNQSTYYGTP